MKWLAQVIGSVLYTYVFSVIVYFITLAPLATIIVWFLSVSLFWKIVLLVVVPIPFIFLLIGLVYALGVVPYRWLLFENKTALVLSALILFYKLVSYGIMVWSDTGNMGIWGVIMCIIATIVLLVVGFQSIPAMYIAYRPGNE